MSTPAVYTMEQRIQGLVTLARFNGNASRASQECGIPERTLRDWKDAPDYEATRQRFQDTIEAEFVKQSREITLLEMEVERKAAERALWVLENEPHRLRGTDAASMAQQMAKAKGQNIDKVLSLTGRPKEIVQHDFGKIVEALVAKRVLAPLPQVVEGTAIEEPAP